MNYRSGMQKSQDVRHSSPAGNLHAAKPTAADRNRPPVKRSNQKYKQRNWKEQNEPHVSDGHRRPLRPDDPGYGNTRKGRQQQLFQQLLEQYGPNFADSDVRLYLKKRHLNAARQRPSRRGGFPLDDSFDKPGTFLKLKPEFQHVILTERCEALAVALRYQLPAEVAWQLYTHTPGLLTYMTLEVAHKVKALAASTGLHPIRLVDSLCSYSPLAFLHPGSVESRLGLVAKLARIDRSQAVQLVSQHPQLWMINSRLLGPRAEELALMLHCCTIAALKLIAQHPRLVTARQISIQQQLTELLITLDCTEQPAALVPLLLWHPALLLPQQLAQQQAETSSSANETAVQQQEGVHVSESKKPTSPQQVAMRLQALAQQLDMPQDLARHMVLQSPDLLTLHYSSRSEMISETDSWNSDSASESSAGPQQPRCVAGLDGLQDSWLCTSAAVKQRQQYQQSLKHLLSPQKTKQRKPQQHHCKQQRMLQVPSRYLDADAACTTAVSCQWWRNREDLAEHTLELEPWQQLLVQAPGLLSLSATAVTDTSTATSSPVLQDTALLAAVATTTEDGFVVQTDGLHNQLHSLCQELQHLLYGTQQRQQQQQQPPRADTPTHQQRSQHDEVQETAVQLLQQLQAASVLEPNMVAQTPTFVTAQLLQLSKVLMVSSRHLWEVVRHCPAVLWLTTKQVFDRVRILCGILRLPAAAVRQLVLTPAVVPVLLLDDDEVRAAFHSAADGAAAEGRTEEVARNVLRRRTELLLPGNLRLFRRAVHDSV